MTQGLMGYLRWPWGKTTNHGGGDDSQLSDKSSPRVHPPSGQRHALQTQMHPQTQTQTTQLQPKADTAPRASASHGAASHASNDSSNITVRDFVRALARAPVIVDLDSETSPKPAALQSSPLKAKHKRRYKKYQRSKSLLVINPSSASEDSDDSAADVPIVETFARRSSGYMEVEKLILSDLHHESLMQGSLAPQHVSNSEGANAPVKATPMRSLPSEELFVPEYSDDREVIAPPPVAALSKQARLNKKRKSADRKKYRELLRAKANGQSIIGSSPYKPFPVAVHSTPRAPKAPQPSSPPRQEVISPVVRAFQMSLQDQKLEMSLPSYPNLYDAPIRETSSLSHSQGPSASSSQKFSVPAYQQPVDSASQKSASQKSVSTSQSANISDIVIPASSEGKHSQLFADQNGYSGPQMAVDSSQDNSRYQIHSAQHPTQSKRSSQESNGTTAKIQTHPYPQKIPQVSEPPAQWKPKKRRILIIPYETKKDPGDELRERFQLAGQDFEGFGVDLDLDLDLSD